MDWFWILGAVWVLLAIALALLIGRSIRLADRKAARGRGVPTDGPNLVVDDRPLHALPPPAPPDPLEARDTATDPGQNTSAAPQPPAPGSAGRDAPTVPGIPSARPAVGHPPVPPSKRPRTRPRRSGTG